MWEKTINQFQVNFSFQNADTSQQYYTLRFTEEIEKISNRNGPQGMGKSQKQMLDLI